MTYLKRPQDEIDARAKLFVDGFLENGEEAGDKDTEAACRLLRSRVSDRHDPLSKAISTELDRRQRA